MAHPLTYQELLRTLGTVLEIAGAENARIELSTDGAQLAAPAQTPPIGWDTEALVNESVAQRSWRLRPRPHDVPAAREIRQRLRVLGARLDAQGGGPYVLVVGPDAIRAQGPNGYDRTFQPADLRYARS